MAWRAPDDAPPVAPLPALRCGHVTFGAFNSCYKITPLIVELWSRILAQVPHSRLVLLAIPKGAATQRVRELFVAHGIESDRIEVLPRLTHDEFLAAHGRVDIALDCHPYHGTTTTCFSLWMGVPVVTLAGRVHAARVGVSLLNNVGLLQLVAQTGDEYVAIAARTAADLGKLAALRESLRGRIAASPLADGRGHARNVESAYRTMWSAWCRNQPLHNGDALTLPPPAAAVLAKPRNKIVKSIYGPVVINCNDTMIGTWLGRDGAWEKDEIELLRWVTENCYAGEKEIVILDVGANVGAHTIAFARFPFSRVTVHAFEAQQELCELLGATIALNALERVHCHRNAVADSSGTTLEFVAIDYERPADFGCFELEAVARPEFEGARVAGRKESVATVRIDDLALNNVRLIKIDVEGMEYEVLSGAEKILGEFHPLVYFEHASGNTDVIKYIEGLLKPKDYRLYWHIANPYNAVNWKGDPQNIFGGMVEVNVLACPPGIDAPQGLAEITAENYTAPRPPLDVAIHGVNIPVPQAQLDGKKDAPVSLAKVIYRRLTGRAASPTR
jgi:FkbM family methyltransferase